MAFFHPITQEHSERGFDFSKSNIVLILAAFVGVGLLLWSQPATPKKPNDLEISTIATPPVNANMLATSNSGAAPAVLGAVTYNKDLVNKFSNIKIVTLSDNSATAIQTYADQVEIVKTNDKLNDLLSPDLSDPVLNTRRDKFVSDLKIIAVPSQLQDYHRLLVAYYSINFSNTGSDAGTINKALDQIEAQLQVMRAAVQNSLGVRLP